MASKFHKIKNYYKKYSNKKVRRKNKMILKRSSYKKIFDLKWTLDI